MVYGDVTTPTVTTTSDPGKSVEITFVVMLYASYYQPILMRSGGIKTTLRGTTDNVINIEPENFGPLNSALAGQSMLSAPIYDHYWTSFGWKSIVLSSTDSIRVISAPQVNDNFIFRQYTSSPSDRNYFPMMSQLRYFCIPKRWTDITNSDLTNYISTSSQDMYDNKTILVPSSSSAITVVVYIGENIIWNLI